MATEHYYDPGTGQLGGSFLPPGAAPAPAWRGPDRTYTPPPDLVSQDPADHGYGPEATHGPVPDNIHGGPFERALDACPECGALEADSVGDQSGEGSNPDDLDGDDSDPHEDPAELVTPGFDDDLDAAGEKPNIRGMGYVPTSYAPSVVPFRARAGAINFSPDRPTTFTR
jgi:hypothetical protein